VSTRIRRDIRRFLLHRFTMLEVPNSSGVRLGAIWKERFGYIAPLDHGALSGWHFAVPEGRAIVIARPEPSQVPEALHRQAAYVIAAKYGISVKLATLTEIPSNLRTRPARLEVEAADLVEQWPPPEPRVEPVVLEHAANAGWYVHENETTSGPWHTPTYELDQAMVFSDAEEANEWLQLRGRPHHLMIRFLVAARSDLDRREIEWVSDGMV